MYEAKIRVRKSVPVEKTPGAFDRRSRGRGVASIASGTALAVGLGLGAADAAAEAPRDAAVIEPARGAARALAGREILIVDPAVEGYAELAAAANRRVDVFVLDPRRDGVAQITEILVRHRGVTAVHLVAHGASGALRLGAGDLTTHNLENYRLPLSYWFETSGAPYEVRPDLLVYGCGVAEGAEGAAFLEKLARITGADVAASTDTTGGSVLGADWILEAAIGRIEATLPIARAVAEGYPGTLDTFVVSSLADSGEGSLRKAVEDANALVGADEIVFSAGDGGVFPAGDIALSSPIAITDSVAIVGPGADVVALDGQGLTQILTATGAVPIDVSIHGISFEDGNAAGSPGAIHAYNTTLRIDECRFVGNTNLGGNGGAIRMGFGDLYVADSEFRDNSASLGGAIADSDSGSFVLVERAEFEDNVATSGGALYIVEATVEIADSTLSNNVASADGGAVVVGPYADLSLTNSTVSQNSAGAGAGAILVTEGAALDLDHVTLTANTSSGAGGGVVLAVDASAVETRIVDSILFGNTSGDQHPLDLRNDAAVAPPLERAMVGAAEGVFALGGPAWIGVDPLLDALAENGGPTRTHALLAASPAIDVGGNASALENDQRGAGYPRVVGAGPDLGAYEVGAPSLEDAGIGDAGDGGPRTSGDGCGCAVAGAGGDERPTGGIGAFFAGVLGALGLRRRRRSARPDPYPTKTPHR